MSSQKLSKLICALAIASASAASVAQNATWESRKFSMNFVDAPLSSAVGTLLIFGGIKAAGMEELPAAKVTIRARSLPLGASLQRLLTCHGYTLTSDAEGYRIVGNGTVVDAATANQCINDGFVAKDAS